MCPSSQNSGRKKGIRKETRPRSQRVFFFLDRERKPSSIGGKSQEKEKQPRERSKASLSRGEAPKPRIKEKGSIKDRASMNK